MKRRAALLLAGIAAAVLVLAGIAAALPSEIPDDTPMVNGPVRAIDQVGSNVWVGGQFTQVQRRDGTLVKNVQNLAVFDSATDQYKDIAPQLGGSGSKVLGIDVYGTSVVIAGTFSGPTSTQKNLVVVDGTTGQVIRWYNAPALQSILATPSLGRIYAGGVGLSAFDFSSGNKLWSHSHSNTSVDPSLRTHAITPGYRDLELDADGSTIWAACGCDAIDGSPVKALVKLDIEGNLDSAWHLNAASTPGVGSASFGISVAQANGALFLGAGGDDFLAQYRKADGLRIWRRDTSGSTQAVEVMDNQLVIGGHFWEVADDPNDPGGACGARTTTDTSKLDPLDQCQTRHGLAVYSFDGALDPNWTPMVEGRYNLVWALHSDDLAADTLHFGGEFTSVNRARQTFYAKLSHGSGDAQAPVAHAPINDLTVAGSIVDASSVPVKLSWSATDDQSGVASYELQQSTDSGASYAKVGLPTPTTTSKTLSLSAGGNYRFRVRAIDGAGNTGEWAEAQPFVLDVRQDEQAGTLHYSGSWAQEALPTAYGGTVMHSETSGSSARLNFSGTDISWVAQKGPDRGKAEVWLDGMLVQTVDLYAASAQPRRVLYSATTLDTSVAHVLEVRVLGTKRVASTDRRVDVDAFALLR